MTTDPSAPTPIWKERFGPEFEAFKRAFLRPVRGLSKTFPCDNPSHPVCGAFSIRKRAGDYVGVCEVGFCSKRTFSEQELVPLELNPPQILSTLACSLGLEASVSLSDPAYGIWHIGRHRPNAHLDFPAFVVLPPDDQDQNIGITNLLSRHQEPLLLGVISESDLSVETRARMNKARAQLFRLDKVAWVSGARIAVSDLWTPIREAFDALAVPQTEYRTATVKKYPTPANACWADVRIRMQTGDDALVRVDGDGSPGWVSYNFREMGMAQKSGKKTLAWKFLVDKLAENYGGPVCPKPAERETFVSRKREIARALVEVFGIPGDPLPFNEVPPEVGYKTAFLIEPEGAE